MTGEHRFPRSRTDGSVVAASRPLEGPLRTLARAGHFPDSMAHDNALRMPEPLRTIERAMWGDENRRW